MESKMSKFSKVPLEPEDPIYGLQVVYKKDARPEKINLSIGVLIDKNLKPYSFSCVKKAEEALLKKGVNYAYLPIDGLLEYRKQVTELVLGKETPKAYTAQTVGGTGALYVAGRFLKEHVTPKIYIPNPTWINHKKLFTACKLEVEEYPYTCKANGTIDIDAILQAIEKMQEGSCILFQASCFNPIGIDPTEEDWKKLSKAVLKKNLIPLFDISYQGVGKGVDEDAQSIRIFFEAGHEMLVCTSFSKNFGLYSDRMGALTITAEHEDLDKVQSQIRRIIRTIYSSPPSHGAYIMSHILENKELKDEWLKELQMIRKELQDVKNSFFQEMQKRGKEKNFSGIKNAVGLFTILNIPKDNVIKLRNEQALYIADDGRVNLAALDKSKLLFIADTLFSKVV